MFEAHADEDLDFESFEKFRKAPKAGRGPNLRKKDYQIRAARKDKERAKQAMLEEVEAAE